MKVGLGVNPNKMQNRWRSRLYKTSDIAEELTEGKLLFYKCVEAIDHLPKSEMIW